MRAWLVISALLVVTGCQTAQSTTGTSARDGAMYTQPCRLWGVAGGRLYCRDPLTRSSQSVTGVERQPSNRCATISSASKTKRICS